MSPKVYLVTGCSSGLGASYVRQLLAKGDKVIATARNISSLVELEKAGAAILALDVTWSPEKLNETVKEAISIYGHIDVLINNAGYVATGVLEGMKPETLLHQFQTNVFGTVNTTNAVLPHMRSRKQGAIVFLSSIAAWQTYAAIGAYCASKAALASIAMCYDQELKEFGIKTLIIEPGYTRTVLLKHGNRTVSKSDVPEYDQLMAGATEFLDQANGNQPGDPEKVVSVTIDMLEQKMSGKDIPLRIPTGSDAEQVIGDTCKEMMQTLKDWGHVVRSADI